MNFKTILFAVVSGFSVAFLPSCGVQSKAGSNNVDGIYSGILSCADCQGIITSLELRKGNYTLRTKDIRNTNSQEIVEQKGQFTLNGSGNVITLNGIDSSEQTVQYAVRDGGLLPLDVSGKPVRTADNNHLLRKTNSSMLTEKYWRLTELNGKAVGNSMRREPHIVLRIADNRITGNSGCNGFSGSYTLNEETKRISFSEMISTRMACMNMEFNEQELLDVFGITDNYSISADGNTLTLNKARMAPLAVFEAVYLY
ncbi:MAG: META domain-containing protein [Prevotellaceae bacterium]|nr:META domain-containing protein [Prevotellaceae bacterium]